MTFTFGDCYPYPDEVRGGHLPAQTAQSSDRAAAAHPPGRSPGGSPDVSLALGFDAVQHCRSLLCNGGGYTHIAEFRCITLAVLQGPLKKFAHGFGGLGVFILLAQQDPGEGYDRVGISALGIRDKYSQILRHFGCGQRCTTTLVRRLYKLAVFVLESGGVQAYFVGKLVTDVPNRSVRLSN